MKKLSLFFLPIINFLILFTPDGTFASGPETSNIQETITLTAGYYFDNNANGYIDSTYIKVNTDITGGLTDDHVQEIIDSDIITMPDFRDFSVNSYAVVSDGFALSVKENTDHDPVTYVTDEDSIDVRQKTLSGGILVEGGAVAVYDKVAPIIHWKSPAAYLTDFQIDTISDTLRVKFSEPVKKVSKEMPFYFQLFETGYTYTADLSTVNQPEPDSMVFIVIEINPGGPQLINDGDSIWIHEGDCVGDVAINDKGDIESNYQNNKMNIKRELSVERILIPFDMIPKVVSPFDVNDIENNVIPHVIVNVLLECDIFNDLNLIVQEDRVIGMLIMVTPDNWFCLYPDFKLKGYLTILDAANNPVLKRTRMAWWDEKKSLVSVWNGRNTSNVKVGSGQYVGVVDYEDRTPSQGYADGGPEKSIKLHLSVANDYSNNAYGCGSGTTLAFIPPIGFKISSLMRKRKKRWAAFLRWLKIKMSFL